MKCNIAISIAIFTLTACIFGQSINKQKTTDTKVLSIKTKNAPLKSIYSDREIDFNLDRVPVGFCGNDIFEIVSEIDRRELKKVMLVKGEFETTIQFSDRVKKYQEERKKPFSENLSYRSNLAIVTNSTLFKYDADNELMSFELFEKSMWFSDCINPSNKKQNLNDLTDIRDNLKKLTRDLEAEQAALMVKFTELHPDVKTVKQNIHNLEKATENIEKKIVALNNKFYQQKLTNNQYRETNAIDFSQISLLPIMLSDMDSFSPVTNFKLNIKEAEKNKPNLRTLLIAKVSDDNSNNYEEIFDNKFLKLNLIEVWVYNNQTGEIYSKLKKNDSDQTTVDMTKVLLERANELYNIGNDELSIMTVKKLLGNEPMSAEAHLLLGKIYLRKKDYEQAISSFKTALFWDNRTIGSYIELAKIYLNKSDCLQAQNYWKSAREFDSKNEEVNKLQQQVEKCK